MQVSAHIFSVSLPNSDKVVEIQSDPRLRKKENKAVLQQAIQATEVFLDEDHTTYSTLLKNHFSTMCDEMHRHLLAIRDIENSEICQGHTRDQALEKSQQYIDSISH